MARQAYSMTELKGWGQGQSDLILVRDTPVSLDFLPTVSRSVASSVQKCLSGVYCHPLGPSDTRRWTHLGIRVFGVLYSQVTVTLTLAFQLCHRNHCLHHIYYILQTTDTILDVWICRWIGVCLVPHSGHWDLNLDLGLRTASWKTLVWSYCV